MNRPEGLPDRFWRHLSRYRLVPWIVGESCCRVELDSVAGGTYEWGRLGLLSIAHDPSEANLLIVSGWINEILKNEIRAAYESMLSPRYVIAVGACMLSASPFSLGSVETTRLSDIVPVDVYVPGCPPRPETILSALLEVRKTMSARGGAKEVIYDALRSPSRSF